MIINLVLKDLLTDTLIYQGPAEIEEIPNGHMFTFEDESYQYCWKVYDNGMTLSSKSEMDVFLTFKERSKTKGHIDSEFGRMDVHTRTKKYHRHPKGVELAYDLIQDQNVTPFHFLLEIEQEILHEVH